MKVAYLGPNGSYSSLAAAMIAAPNDELLPCRDFESVFNSLTDQNTKAVIPVENSIEGAVATCLDLLIERDNFTVTGEILLQIDHRIFSLKGHGEILHIYSHPQAYNQCRHSLKKLFPNALFCATSSTSEALNHIDSNSIAVASAVNYTDTYDMSGETVADNPNNTTRFLVLQAVTHACCAGDKVSVVFEAANKPGGLLKLLEILYCYGRNMTKIESRPHKSQLGRYLFFVDFLGSLDDDNTCNALEALKSNTMTFKLLGNYSRIESTTQDQSK